MRRISEILGKAMALAAAQRDVLLSDFSSLTLRIVGLISSFGLGVVLARSLGPVEYGIYGLVISVSAVAMSFALLGTPQVAVRELSYCSATGDWPGIRRLICDFGAATLAASLLAGGLATGVAWFGRR